MPRVEINLEGDILEALQRLADSDGRSRKNYMENVLLKHVKDAQVNSTISKVKQIISEVNKKKV